MDKKIWIIIRHEYLRHVLRWRFLLAVFSLPLAFLFAMIMGMITVSTQIDRTPIGYVDQAHFITIRTLPKGNFSSFFTASFAPYATEEEARTALEKKEIQAYFVLPADYLKTFKARLVYLKAPYTSPAIGFRNLLRINLLAGQSKEVAERVSRTPTMVIQASSEGQESPFSGVLRTAAPMGIGFLIMLSIMSSSGYLAKAFAEDKENRMMEILVTSVSPADIMTGKITALISVGLTQMLAWAGLPLIYLVFVVISTPLGKSLVEPTSFLLLFVMAAATLGLVAIVIATLGITFADGSEAQQMTGLLSMITMLPIFFGEVIMNNPGGPIAMILSFFPFTAFWTFLMRIGFSTVPTWQLLISAVVLVGFNLLALWLAGRIFRESMLRYGKGLNLKEIARAVLPRARKVVRL